jgi:hypothetical protein
VDVGVTVDVAVRVGMGDIPNTSSKGGRVAGMRAGAGRVHAKSTIMHANPISHTGPFLMGAYYACNRREHQMTACF